MSFAQNSAISSKPYVLVIHGGAGEINKAGTSPELEAAYKASLDKALKAGEEILKKGGDAIDAVQAAIMILENDSLFNAGKGAVLNNKGMAELDASIMRGDDLNAGAVAGVTNVKNPISAARLVMDKSPHVMLGGQGAEEFAKANGCELVDNNYFITDKNRKRLEQIKSNKGKKSQVKQPENRDGKYGTVGAVALDKNGNLAAGTSTGGMTNKKFGRIGDSPIIGAGTYADNMSCAVSCTGWGEYYIRLGFAKSICDRVELQGVPLKEATKLMIHDKLENMGASGGVIAIDRYGNYSIDYNTSGMHRAWVSSNGDTGVELY